MGSRSVSSVATGGAWAAGRSAVLRLVAHMGSGVVIDAATAMNNLWMLRHCTILALSPRPNNKAQGQAVLAASKPTLPRPQTCAPWCHACLRMACCVSWPPHGLCLPPATTSACQVCPLPGVPPHLGALSRAWLACMQSAQGAPGGAAAEAG